MPWYSACATSDEAILNRSPVNVDSFAVLKYLMPCASRRSTTLAITRVVGLPIGRPKGPPMPPRPPGPGAPMPGGPWRPAGGAAAPAGGPPAVAGGAVGAGADEIT